MGKGGDVGASSDEGSNPTVWREDEGIALRVPKYYGKAAASSSSSSSDTRRVVTMDEVRKHTTRDDLWIVVDSKAYDVTKYVDRHPGGWLPMQAMAGRDCTEAFANYHPARVYRTLLPPYYVADVSDCEETEFVKGHRDLRQRLLAEGMFETRISHYLQLATWLSTLFVGALYLTLGCASFTAHMGGALLLALFWQQIAFVGHDVGHNAITHRVKLDSAMGVVIGNLLTGIAMSWWKRSHNVHHVVCNSVEHDPDIQHMPIFAVTNKIFKRFWSTYHSKWVETGPIARTLVGYQHYLFYPVMAFARFNLYIQSWLLLLLSDEKPALLKYEIAGQLGFLAWLGAVVYSLPAGERVPYLLLSHGAAGLLHVQICLSHFGMETYEGLPMSGDEKSEWFRMQVATTLNIDCPPWMDWFHGGLQFQVEHHLWPRLPRHNLRYAAKLVKEFCAEHDVEYHSLGWFAAQADMLRNMKHTAMEARKLKSGDGGFFHSALWEGMNAQG